MRMIIRPPILDDEKYLYCISLATLSKNDKRSDERHGSLLVKENQIGGRGVNRAISHPKFRLERIIRQGWNNHAEIEALNDALANGLLVEGGDLYTAGYFFASGRLFLQRRYTCPICPPYMKKCGIASINIPAPEGWERKSLDKAMEEAKYFKGNAYEKRQAECIGNYSIDMIRDRLLEPCQLEVSYAPIPANKDLNR
jgi:hypothetical protein